MGDLSSEEEEDEDEDDLPDALLPDDSSPSHSKQTPSVNCHKGMKITRVAPVLVVSYNLGSLLFYILA